eukprot:s1332_g16.t1
MSRLTHGSVPECDFTTAFSSFCFASLCIRPEVVSSLGKECQEDLNLMASCTYANKFTWADQAGAVPICADISGHP